MFTSYWPWASCEAFMFTLCSISSLATLCIFKIAGIGTYIESHRVDVFGCTMSNYMMNHVVRLLAYISLWEAFTHFIFVDYIAFVFLLVLGIISMFKISQIACCLQQ
ncbi:hypothetical protein QYE76_043672 [Lolium multiflorum]|uniref:Uncharacterized protein n=1 Tax=Lolium multiflorum TaxID=4521 RepID=A0AAD8THG1_LOLMU|nr:hypothetical protein QYE76_043672 [Lolium multiflorum]